MSHSRPQEGFTLIELLVVIGILGVLAVAFLPDIIGGQATSDREEARVRMQRLQSAADRYENKLGHYPPDDLNDPLKKLKLKADNGVNTSIESFVVFVSEARVDLSQNSGWLGNTDSDQNGREIKGLGQSKRLEMLDPWGNPIAYFSAFTGGMSKTQKIQLGETFGGSVVRAKAWSAEAGGPPLGGKKCQFVSAGQDGQFNTDDDITWPERPQS